MVAIGQEPENVASARRAFLSAARRRKYRLDENSARHSIPRCSILAARWALRSTHIGFFFPRVR